MKTNTHVDGEDGGAVSQEEGICLNISHLGPRFPEHLYSGMKFETAILII